MHLKTFGDRNLFCHPEERRISTETSGDRKYNFHLFRKANLNIPSAVIEIPSFLRMTRVRRYGVCFSISFRETLPLLFSAVAFSPVSLQKQY